METFYKKLVKDGVEYYLKFEPVNDTVLQELYYIVTLHGCKPFIMAISFETGNFKIQGEAPYVAQESEDAISLLIEQHNNL